MFFTEENFHTHSPSSVFILLLFLSFPTLSYLLILSTFLGIFSLSFCLFRPLLKYEDSTPMIFPVGNFVSPSHPRLWQRARARRRGPVVWCSPTWPRPSMHSAHRPDTLLENGERTKDLRRWTEGFQAWRPVPDFLVVTFWGVLMGRWKMVWYLSLSGPHKKKKKTLSSSS